MRWMMKLGAIIGVLGLLSRAATAQLVVGYYTDWESFTKDPEGGILDNGLTPVHIFDISTFDLGTIDILVINNASNFGITDALAGRIQDIEAWVLAGGKVMSHDRYVSVQNQPSHNPLLFNAPEATAQRELTSGNDIDVHTPGTLVTQGPFGTIANTTLDEGHLSNHGFIVTAGLPNGTTNILIRGGKPGQSVMVAYPSGDGAVIYSTIPLDFYLAGMGKDPPQSAMVGIYYPNTLAYLAEYEYECYADCNQDGELNIQDFICFHDAYEDLSDSADCDGDGLLSILDFICFQQEFLEGCP